MKKILIAIIGIFLLILLCVIAFKGVQIGKLKLYSINQTKEASYNLDTKIEEANTEISQNYSKSVDDLNSSIKELNTNKQQYEEKITALGANPELGLTQIEKYKIEYLWGIIGNYAQDENLKLDLDIEKTSINDVYNIKFTIQGTYVGITNFIYDIENDDELNYKIKDFKIEPSTVVSKSTGGTEQANTDTSKLKATFAVENVIINYN